MYSSLIISAVIHDSGFQFWAALTMAAATVTKSRDTAQSNTARAQEPNMFKQQTA